MLLFSNYSIKIRNYFSLVLSLMPVSFIAGNLIINLNILVLTISALLVFKKEIFNIKYLLIDKLLFLYFFLILFTGIYNDYYFYLNELSWKGYFSTITKSLYFFKYLFLYIVLRFLIERDVIKLKFFFISCLITSLFVCLDIFFQFIYGQDIFGFEATNNGRKLSGPFGDELIAGGFIQRFSIFSFFILPLFYSDKSKLLSKYLIPILFVIFLLGIIFSGNRMPMVLFVLTIFLIVIFNKQTRKFFIPFIIIFSLLFATVINLNNEVRFNFYNFKNQISKMTTLVINNDFENKNAPQYFKEFSTFYETWLMNKYIGGGIKNFRYYCHVRPKIDKDSKFICNMHPHNYYLEILTETGLVGLLILILIFSLVLYRTLYKKYFLHSLTSSSNLAIPFIFLFLIEIFPLKSTGSFFTTGNTTYLFLILGILIGLFQKDNLVEKKS